MEKVKFVMQDPIDNYAINAFLAQRNESLSRTAW
jgi:hypothetical protein